MASPTALQLGLRSGCDAGVLLNDRTMNAANLVYYTEAEEIESERWLLKHKARNGIAVAEAVAEEHGHCQ